MKVGFVSLGCCKNLVDSEDMMRMLKEEGHEIVGSVRQAEAIIVNTCGFIASAKEESIQTIFEMASYKEKQLKRLIVCGCLAQRYQLELEQEIPEIDAVIPIRDYDQLAARLRPLLGEGDQSLIVKAERVLSGNPWQAYLKISDGCSNRCTYCAIPLIRGPQVSRPIEDIVKEAKYLASIGVKELTLIAQDTTKYGYDLYKKLALVDLLKELVKIEGDFKIRILYLYPEVVTDELIEFIKNEPKMMHYFDIPMQHSETKILKKMYRRSDKELLTNLFHKIRENVPDAILRTTIIVGFPYEEEEDMDNLIEFIKDIKFDRLGAFTFSLEEGTKACEYPNIISEKTKQARYERLMKTQSEIALKNNEKYMNQILNDCFIIDYDESSYMYVARSYAYAPDEIDGCIYIASKRELSLGERVNVKILDVKDESGQHVFEKSDEARTPAYMLFALPEDMHLLFRKAVYLVDQYDVQLILVPNTQKLTDEDSVMVSSEDIQSFINSKTKMVSVDEILSSTSDKADNKTKSTTTTTTTTTNNNAR